MEPPVFTADAEKVVKIEQKYTEDKESKYVHLGWAWKRKNRWFGAFAILRRRKMKGKKAISVQMIHKRLKTHTSKLEDVVFIIKAMWEKNKKKFQ